MEVEGYRAQIVERKCEEEEKYVVGTLLFITLLSNTNSLSLITKNEKILSILILFVNNRCVHLKELKILTNV